MANQYYTVEEWRQYNANSEKKFVKGESYNIELKTFWKTGKGNKYAQVKAVFLGFKKMDYYGNEAVWANFQIGNMTKLLRLFPEQIKGTGYTAVFDYADKNFVCISQ